MAEMGWLEKARWYRRTYGIRAMIVRMVEIILRVRPAHQAAAHAMLGAGYTPRSQDSHHPPAVAEEGSGLSRSVQDVIASRFAQIEPFQVFSAPGPDRRINLVTDSVSKGSLFGGVGTALLLAVELAKATGSKLRVVTRTEYADEAGVGRTLESNNISFDGNIEFSHVPFDGIAQLDVCPGDRFLTTSWWTTASVLGSISPDKVDYILQEDERMFYPYGDERLRCEETLSRTDIRYAINTKLLHDYLIETGLENLGTRSVYFEPAFPHKESKEMTPSSTSGANGQKKRLFFYARPNNVRNLYYRGIEALEAAVAEGIIDLDKWEIVFVGKDAEKIQIGGSAVTLLPTMNWNDYQDFTRSVDLAFCLMYTPHPSYPPLDIASVGGVVLTNSFESKQDLSEYSRNILVAKPELPGLVNGLRDAVHLVDDIDRRQANLKSSKLGSNWAEALHNVVKSWSQPEGRVGGAN